MNLNQKKKFIKKTRPYLFLVAALVIFGQGCAPRNLVKIQEKIGADGTSGWFIDAVPFVRQEKNWCGPAALASVVRFWGREISQKEIAEEVYLSSINGTLDFDLEHYAHRIGFWAQSYRGGFADLEKHISSNFPLIVLQKPYPFLRRYHYLVVIGYYRPGQLVIVHSGRKSGTILPYRRLLRTWEACDYWTLLVCPPEKVVWALEPEGYNRLGIIFEEQEKFDRAIENYLKALSGFPDRAEYHFNLGNVRRKKKSFDEAREAYLKAIALEPDYADAYNNLAITCLEENSRLEECREYLQKAIRLRPDRGKYYWDTLGEVYLRQGELDAALDAFTRALDLTGPEEREILSVIYRHLGQVYEAKGMWEQAELNFRKARESRRDD